MTMRNWFFDNYIKNIKSSNVYKPKFRNEITAPSLLSIKSLINNFKTHSVITQKIDGITRKNISLNNSFPRCSLNNLFDVEYLDNNVNFIIGIKNSRLFNNKTFVDLIFDLRSSHDFTKNNIFPRYIGIEDIRSDKLTDLIKTELVNFKRYMNIVKSNAIYRGKILWWPKMFFELKYTSFSEYVELLAFFETHSKIFGIFPNDGWIIQHKEYLCNTDSNDMHKTAFKIKPLNLLTLDLMFKEGKWYYGDKNILKEFTQSNNIEIYELHNVNYIENKVCRCYPKIEYENLSIKLVGYIPNEIRNDRLYPNPENISNDIIYQTNKHFRLNDIYKYISTKQGDYYQHGIDKNLIHKKRNYAYNNCLVSNHITGNIIDIGGGDLEKTMKFINSNDRCDACNNSVMNVDNDINIVINNMTRSEYSGKVYCGFLDFTKSFEEYNKIEKQLSVIDNTYNSNLNVKFDTLLMINSINFALKNSKSMTVFMNYIRSFSKTGSKIIIRWMDFDAFLSKYKELRFGNIEYSDSKNTILINSPYDSSFVNIDLTTNTNRIYYKWAHKTPINETLIGKNELKNIFKLNDREYIDYKYQNNYKKISGNSNIWDLYFNSFSFIVFQKN